MSELIFTCENTGREFNTGFKTSLDELRLRQPQSGASLFCQICGVIHEFEFAAASVCTCGYNCRQEHRDCQLAQLNR